MNQRRALRVLFFVLVIFLLAGNAYLAARAGGAGGSSGSSGGGFSSGGGDGGAILYVVYFMFEVLGPIPTVIIIAVVGLGAAYAQRKNRQQGNSVYRSAAATDPDRKHEGVERFSREHADFNEAEFVARVKTAFLGIQEAWQAQSMAPVRRFVSDALYQRFHTQFLMMKKLEQVNELSNISIQRVWIQKADSDRLFDVLDVGIQARMTDKFVCKSNASLNSGGTETFTEFWSFVRRKNAHSGADIYHSSSCPNCSAPLPEDLGERGQCPYCNTLVNSGEYDWVLSEITQADDYGAALALTRRSGNFGKVDAVLRELPDTTVQTLEDTASNAYLQVVGAQVLGEPERMRRFTSQAAYEKLTSDNQPGLVYNRLYINHAATLHAKVEDRRVHAAVALRVTAQRAALQDGRARLIDAAPFSKEIVVELSRDLPAQGFQQKGSVLMHQCASCGAAVGDSLDTACAYCGQALNSGKFDWVLTGVGTLDTYAQPKQASAPLRPKQLDALYDVKDYALLNMMVVLAADGEYSPEERSFAEEVARSFGYKPEALQALFAQASTGRLGIRMPHDVSKRGRIFKLMEQAAMADGRLEPEERQILDQIRSTYVLHS